MTVYAIRHKPTGGYLPEKKGSGMRRGFTHTEPSISEPPRLFRKEGDAVMALRSWLEGKWVPKLHVVHNDYNLDGKYKLEILHAPGRKAEDMEIVEVDFIIVSRKDWP